MIRTIEASNTEEPDVYLPLNNPQGVTHGGRVRYDLLMSEKVQTLESNIEENRPLVFLDVNNAALGLGLPMMVYSSSGGGEESLSALRAYFFTDCPKPDLDELADESCHPDKN